ncbi:NAD(P)-dependent alcohol dehydrogenase [Microbacterium sp. HD4P20]|uniref:zinc-dependent alcohol dehydrogenase family protein n=1 Tax=Microbacterium sp. HD4P20 TaxID=2864874 RepID=UPI001C6423AF|nr:NAD(P)-dependent alcohol dehydrogenase [Microbacterium sp. HD4P20]MCP2635199.1 NAD(P)-dependent alcohol dehydrogenase [Microbacterium sp. HD4P20]
MRAWHTAGDGIDALESSEREVPVPGSTEVLVRIGALSLNYRDLLVIEGEGGWRPESSVVPISDAVGTVVAVGDRVTRFSEGDRALPVFLPFWRDGGLTAETYHSPVGGPVNRGMLADYVVVDEQEAVRPPSHLDDAGAATLPIAGLTAWHAVTRTAVGAGDTVLIHGTGGVALFAAQIAIAKGARVIITSSSPDKRSRAERLGVVAALDYRNEDVAARVSELTDGAGADVVIETIGGTNLNLSLEALRIGGRIAFIGLIEGLTAEVSTYMLVTKNATLHGIETGSRAMLEQLVEFTEEHELIPIIDSAYDLDDIRDALKHLKAGNHFGKIVLRA